MVINVLKLNPLPRFWCVAHWNVVHYDEFGDYLADAEVAKITVRRSPPASTRTTAQLIVRRVNDGSADERGELFKAWFHHAVIVDNPRPLSPPKASTIAFAPPSCHDGLDHCDQPDQTTSTVLAGLTGPRRDDGVRSQNHFGVMHGKACSDITA